MNQSDIRNFCIIAHIDHGKSTLADRFLELTGTVSERNLREQFLDQMDLERERGITIKLQPVRMEYKTPNDKSQIANNFSNTNLQNSLGFRSSDSGLPDSEYILNLVDTPGHVDFSYEVSRSLAAVEGAILLVDVIQGIQAQTLANLHLAQKQGLKIIGAVNKIDLVKDESVRRGLAEQLAHLLNQPAGQIFFVSGKTGEGAGQLLDALISELPRPQGNPAAPLRALIFDSLYDAYRGVIACVRVIDGSVKTNDALACLATKANMNAIEIGLFKPQQVPGESLSAGEIGYIATGIKDPSLIRVGDTITQSLVVSNKLSVNPLPGYQEPQPVVFVSLYPQAAETIEALTDALSKLKLNDAALTYIKERQEVLGQGYRIGCLGTLHLEIVKERLKREYRLEPVITVPSVKYVVNTRDGRAIDLFSAQNLPSADQILNIQEPWVSGEIVSPVRYLGGILGLIQGRRGIHGAMENLSADTVILRFEMPLNEIIIDFYDKLKSVSQGYASLSYELFDYRLGDLVRLDILIAGDAVNALARMVPRVQAEAIGRRVIGKLKELLERELFPVALQAAIGTQIIARETLPALKKNVTLHLYGGDRSRKMKLWKKQKQGKKRLAQFGKVRVKPEVFFEVFKVAKD
jgi:GTP-binding protein LepA